MTLPAYCCNLCFSVRGDLGAGVVVAVHPRNPVLQLNGARPLAANVCFQ